MPDTNQSGGTTTTGAIDMDALGKLIKANTEAAVADAVKPLNDRLAAFEKTATTQATGKEAASAKPLTEADIDARVEAKLKAAQDSAAAKAVRDAYANDRLKDLPAVYRNQLGNDPAKFAEEEQKIRDTYKADFKASGGVVKDVAGVPNVAAGQPPAAAVNLDGKSPQQNIEAGLREAETKK